MKDEIIITDKLIKELAVGSLGREISQEEYDEIVVVIWDDIADFLRDSIGEVVDLSEGHKKYIESLKIPPFFNVYHCGDISLQSLTFEKISVKKSAIDAEHFIADNKEKSGYWLISEVDGNCKERWVFFAKY
jgi:hypothetical protein